MTNKAQRMSGRAQAFEIAIAHCRNEQERQRLFPAICQAADEIEATGRPFYFLSAVYFILRARNAEQEAAADGK